MSEDNTTVDATVEVIDSGVRQRVELTGAQIGALMGPLNRARVKQRQMSGKAQSYLEAWDVKATLLRIFGFGGFSVEVIEANILDVRDDGRQGTYPQGHQKAGQHKTPYVMAYARVRLTIHGIGPQGQDVVYTEASIGTNDGYTIGDVADNAIKSAASDALKRCAIFLGTQFGLGLYDNGSLGDVVRVLFEPEQAAMLAAHRAGPEQQQQPEFDPEAEANFARALGATRIEEPLPSSGTPALDKAAAVTMGMAVGDQSPVATEPVVMHPDQSVAAVEEQP